MLHISEHLDKLLFCSNLHDCCSTIGHLVTIEKRLLGMIVIFRKNLFAQRILLKNEIYMGVEWE